MTKRELRNWKWKQKRFYETKYQTMYRNTIEFEGLTSYEASYIMDRVYNGHAIAAFALNTNAEIELMVGFGTFATTAFGMYQQPVEVKVIKENNSPFIPNHVLRLNRDVAILDAKYCPRELIASHIEKLIEIDITMNQNLVSHRMPFMIQSNDVKNLGAISDLVEGMNIVEVNSTEVVGVLNTQTPYILDNLNKYKTEVEHEILTILGIDNVKEQMRGAQMNNDQVNANNQEINIFKDSVVRNLELWFDEIYDIFGVSIDVVQRDYLDGGNEYGEQEEEKEDKTNEELN